MKKIAYAIVSILILYDCSSSKNENDNLQTLKIEEYLAKWEPWNLSQFSNSITYIQLQSTESPLSSIYLNCSFSDSLILVNDYSNCYLFSKNGDFIRKIGNQGRGPGEYLMLSQINFGNIANIYLKSSYDLVEYSVNGQFFNRYKNTLKNNTGTINNWLQINDSLFIGYIANSSGTEKNRFVIFNKYGNVFQEFTNYRILLRKGSFFSNEESFSDIYRFKNQIFIKQIVNDTLFILTSDYVLKPKYVFDFGKFKYQPFLGGPDELMDYSTNQGNIITLKNIFQTDEYYLLCCDFHLNFPAKRLTPKTVRENITTVYNTTLALGILNKKTNDFSFCKTTETDNQLFTTGLFNDIDCGPRFYPTKQVNDSTLLMWIKAEDFLNHISSDDFKNSVPKNPEKKKQLEEFADKITMFDNPILMCVTIN
jgi:hypothetical protein